MVSAKNAKAMITANAKLNKMKGSKQGGRKQIYGLLKVKNGNSKRYGI
jgi:hypothetical protein